MPYEEKDGGWKETLLGLVVIVVVLWGGIYVFRAIYSKIFPSVPAAPGVVSMSAYFVDDTGAYVPSDSPNYGKSRLKIKGDVSQGGQLVKSGSVRLTVRPQSISTVKRPFNLLLTLRRLDIAFWPRLSY